MMVLFLSRGNTATIVPPLLAGANGAIAVYHLLSLVTLSSPPFVSDFGKIPDDNIIARNALLCLLAVRMNFGVPDDFYVRQIVMGNLF